MCTSQALESIRLFLTTFDLKCEQSEGEQTHFALLPVQVELVLTDGHHPDGFNQRVAGIPRVNHQAGLSERSLGHCSSGEEEEITRQTFSTRADPRSKSVQSLHTNSKQLTGDKQGFNSDFKKDVLHKD